MQQESTRQGDDEQVGLLGPACRKTCDREKLSMSEQARRAPQALPEAT